eukprot:3996616-Prymnesium_polylepis.1
MAGMMTRRVLLVMLMLSRPAAGRPALGAVRSRSAFDSGQEDSMLGDSEARMQTAATTLADVLRMKGGTNAAWTYASVLQSASLFVVAGLTEIGGGWLVWQAVRERRPWWWAVLGAAALVGYGYVPTWQPEAAGSEFGRLDAAYGG